MKREKDTIRFMVKRYMFDNYVDSFYELSKMTGIKYDTLNAHLKEPEKLRKYEIKLLDDALHFNDEDLVKIIRS